jgi:ParB-like chromosome segregation protein Spo0J
MDFHEAANIFPLDEGTIADLAKDIEKNGLLQPIELFDGKIIDGRRRFQACQQVGVKPEFRDIETSDPVAYSWSLNGPRRHCTPAQLSMVGARMREIYDRQAKERQVESGKNHGKGKVPVNLPEPISKGDSRDIVGKLVGVSGKSIDHATKIIKHAIPEVVKAVDEGRMAVSTAAILATEPPEVQREEATNPKRNRLYKPNAGGGKQAPAPSSKSKSTAKATPKKQAGDDVVWDIINQLYQLTKSPSLKVPYGEIKTKITELREVYSRQREEARSVLQ